MKKIILLIILALTIVTTLPSNSYSFDGKHPRRVVVVHKWPRHHVVIIFNRWHRHHRHHHRFRGIPPIWIPRDPWR